MILKELKLVRAYRLRERDDRHDRFPYGYIGNEGGLRLEDGHLSVGDECVDGGVDRLCGELNRLKATPNQSPNEDDCLSRQVNDLSNGSTRHHFSHSAAMGICRGFSFKAVNQLPAFELCA